MDEHARDELCGPVRGDGSYPSDQAPGGPENGAQGVSEDAGFSLRPPGPPPPHLLKMIDEARTAPSMWRRLAGRRGPSGHSVAVDPGALHGPSVALYILMEPKPSGHSVGMVEAWGQLRSTADIGGIFTRPSGHSVTNPGDKHMKINITVVIEPIDPNAVAANPRDVMDEVAWLLEDRRVRAQAQDRPDGYKAYYKIRRVDVEEAGS